MQRTHFYSKIECYIWDYALEFLCGYSSRAKILNSHFVCVCVFVFSDGLD